MAVNGRIVIDFLHRERRKGLVAEAAFETHLQAVFDRQGRSCNRGESLRDADSVWWRKALGPQHKRYGRVSKFATEKEKAEFAAGLCRCGMRVCRCPIDCVSLIRTAHQLSPDNLPCQKIVRCLPLSMAYSAYFES